MNVANAVVTGDDNAGGWWWPRMVNQREMQLIADAARHPFPQPSHPWDHLSSPKKVCVFMGYFLLLGDQGIWRHAATWCCASSLALAMPSRHRECRDSLEIWSCCILLDPVYIYCPTIRSNHLNVCTCTNYGSPADAKSDLEAIRLKWILNGNRKPQKEKCTPLSLGPNTTFCQASELGWPSRLWDPIMVMHWRVSPADEPLWTCSASSPAITDESTNMNRSWETIYHYSTIHSDYNSDLHRTKKHHSSPSTQRSSKLISHSSKKQTDWSFVKHKMIRNKFTAQLTSW